jgi:hypothetical protein
VSELSAEVRLLWQTFFDRRLFEDPALCDHTESLWRTVSDRLARPPSPPTFESLIVVVFPPPFQSFDGKQWALLWRGSRDGFSALEFHRCYDGRANTLTLILDTDGNIFRSFSSVKLETPSNTFGCKGDESLWSFPFTRRNPRGVPAQTFTLRAEQKQFAIYCHLTLRTRFDWHSCFRRLQRKRRRFHSFWDSLG